MVMMSQKPEVYREYWGNGKLRKEIHRKNGMLNGRSTFWYENGKTHTEVYYKNDALDGSWTSWYDNGKKQGEGLKKNGKLYGLVTNWYKNGKKKIQKHYENGKLIASGLFKIAEEDGLKNDQMEGFKRAVNILSSTFDGLGFCLSEKKDLLSQWRGYANDAHGVSIGFSKDYLRLLSDSLKSDQKPGFSLKKVIYTPDEIRSTLEPTYLKIKEYIGKGAYKRLAFQGILGIKPAEDIEKENINIQAQSNLAFEALLPLIGDLYSLKSKAFEEEIEWRLISLLSKIPGAPPDPCLFHPFLNKIKPYRSFQLIDLKVNPIGSIVLGPKNSTPKYVIESFLKQNNFVDVEVLLSEASYI